MKVSYKWLKEYLDLSDVTPAELAEKMSRTGIEVERRQFTLAKACPKSLSGKRCP